jgi:hypothetical protein
LTVAASAPGPAQEIPPLSELRRPITKAQVEELAESARPSPVAAGNMIGEPLLVTPAGAAWFFTCNDVRDAAGKWDSSPVAGFLDEPRVKRMFRDNQFNVAALFSDLPRAVIPQERVTAAQAALNLAIAMLPESLKAAAAGYISRDGDFSLLFLFDIGADRNKAFDVLAEWETNLFLTAPGTSTERDEHSGSFLDVWTLPLPAGEERGAEIAAGFHENYAVIANDAALAKRVFALPGNAGDSLLESPYGRRLVASAPTAQGSDLYGFLRLREVIQGLAANPVTHNELVAWANLVGGVDVGDAIYYGVRMVAEGGRETCLVPLGGGRSGASVPRSLAAGLRPAEGWTAPTCMPYQPSPSRFFSAMFEKGQLGRMVRIENALFGEVALPDFLRVPKEGLSAFSESVIASLTGEIATAYFSADYDQSEASWITVLATQNDISRLLPTSVSLTEKAGVNIHSISRNWRSSVSWAAIPQTLSRRLTGNFLMFASSGDLLNGAIEQIFSGLTFSENRDFNNAMANAEANQGLLFYLNVPEIVVREFPNLSVMARKYFPRSSGLNSRPPLNLMRRYAAGLLGVVAPGSIENEFLRITVQAPFPSFGAVGLWTILGYPSSLRSSGREGMAKSRENLQRLWLRLQLFSSRNGHFPIDVEELIADMRTSMTNEEIREIFTAPGALFRLGPAEAARRSYHYVSGLTPNDEPDIPLLYETEPWSEDFSGMHPTESGKPPRETGIFQNYRQYIRLDGEAMAVPEKTFIDRVLGHLKDRE